MRPSFHLNDGIQFPVRVTFNVVVVRIVLPLAVDDDAIPITARRER